MDLGAPSPTPPRHDNRADNSDASLLGQDTAYHERKSARHRRRAGVLSWRSRHGSIYLHRISLIGMALLFICFFVLIEVLNNFSSRDQGFVDTQESSHYLWRFGPTLVLSLVAALWGQVEYQVESAMPWVELRRQPLPAEKNLLLNYRSPWSITSLFRSLKAGHFAVGVAIFGGFVLKALIVVSTGLFAAEGRSVTQSAEFQVVDRFNFSLHRNSLVENVVANIDPGVAFWAINTGNVPPPAGVNPEFATVSFSTRAAADCPLTPPSQPTRRPLASRWTARHFRGTMRPGGRGRPISLSLTKTSFPLLTLSPLPMWMFSPHFSCKLGLSGLIPRTL